MKHQVTSRELSLERSQKAAYGLTCAPRLKRAVKLTQRHIHPRSDGVGPTPWRHRPPIPPRYAACIGVRAREHVQVAIADTVENRCLCKEVIRLVAGSSGLSVTDMLLRTGCPPRGGGAQWQVAGDHAQHLPRAHARHPATSLIGQPEFVEA